MVGIEQALLWVPPCSITTSSRAVPAKQNGTKSQATPCHPTCSLQPAACSVVTRRFMLGIYPLWYMACCLLGCILLGCGLCGLLIFLRSPLLSLSSLPSLLFPHHHHPIPYRTQSVCGMPLCPPRSSSFIIIRSWQQSEHTSIDPKQRSIQPTYSIRYSALGRLQSK